MTRYLARRLAHALVVTLCVTAVVFVLLHMLPGGPVRASLPINATPAQVAELTRQYGYDRPLHVQYGTWMWNLLRGDLGFSPQLNMPVRDAITERLPKTMTLMVLGIGASLLIGVPMGIYQAARRYQRSDYLLTGATFLSYAAPVFFVGLLLIDLLAVSFRVFPAGAPQGDSVAEILSQPNALVLPVATFAFCGFAQWSRFIRSATMDNLVQDYVRTARSIGASERQVLWVHVTRNSLITIVTLLGLHLPTLFAGAVIVETVFNYPGMGLMFWQAAQNHDYPILLGVVLFGTILTIVGSILADIGYAVLDPRVRLTA
ncbi:ABC transporter permease [Jiangella asiatica]|uniref:ABC transporter permease n=1 Tax=Jiangella asiatica TaxID=2530372 RepID=A0A4V2Z2D9_9ACTN|nr:ABC transporter permease [Jiangella asiatica]TDE08458.1 ABC transporter permease [Jiangella asiatica]